MRLAVLLFLLALPLPALADDCATMDVTPGERTDLRLKSEGRSHLFRVELVDGPDERSQGLMCRRSLPPDAGMRFDFEEERPVSMWMKNTLIPLDMLFIDAGGTVVAIAADRTPRSLVPVVVEIPVRYVLELPAGTAAALAIRPGAKARHPAIGG